MMPTELSAPSPPRQRRPFEFSGRMMLASLLGFFVVVAGVNGLMMTMAIKTMPGVDVKSAYEVGQRFNGEIARMQAQTERGWQAQAHVGRAGAGRGAEIVLTLLDHDGKPITGLGVEASLQHPATRRQDQDIALTETAPGRYSATIDEVHAGGWTLAVRASRAGEAVFVSRSRIVLKD